jgi:hypothetical protein
VNSRMATVAKGALIGISSMSQSVSQKSKVKS